MDIKLFISVHMKEKLIIQRLFSMTSTIKEIVINVIMKIDTALEI